MTVLNPYTASVSWDPDPDAALGFYDLSCTVVDNNGDGLTGTAVFVDNSDELELRTVCVNTGLDADCNAADEDCDGLADNHYASRVTECGLGACVANGTTSCQEGTETDSCQPGPAGWDDVACDGIDDNCNGLSDEEYVPDASCGVGYCQKHNVPSSCTHGIETPCVSGLPLGDTDTTCDGIDDNCDGWRDEGAVLAADGCGSPTNACLISVCNPTAGRCETSAISGCCSHDADCVTPSACVATACDSESHRCLHSYPTGCCATAVDCADGNACTADNCDATSGACAPHRMERCCVTNADCHDADPCSLDECTAAHRCQHRPVACAAGPCGEDTGCTYSGLYLSSGSQSPSVAQVHGLVAAITVTVIAVAIPRRRRPRRLVAMRSRLALCLWVSIALAGFVACARTGFGPSWSGTISIADNTDVGLDAGPDHRLWVHGAPLTSSVIHVWMVD